MPLIVRGRKVTLSLVLSILATVLLVVAYAISAALITDPLGWPDPTDWLTGGLAALAGATLADKLGW